MEDLTPKKEAKLFLDLKYRETNPSEWSGLPIEAIKGVSEPDAELLRKAFNIKTVADLATLKYARWAEEIVELADKGATELSGFEDKLIKEYEKRKPAGVARAPIYALQGVSQGDADKLAEAFRIKTVRSFSKLKYYKMAKELHGIQMELIEKEAIRHPHPGTGEEKLAAKHKKSNFMLIALIIALILVLLLFFYLMLRKSSAHMVEVSGEEFHAEADAAFEEMEDDLEGEPADTAEAEQAVSSVSSASSVEPEPTAPAATDGYYVVAPGDTLAVISHKKYGTYRKTRAIFNANRSVLSNPNKIWPGMKLKLP